MIQAIKKRRSVREFLAEKISEDKLQEIIKAAMCAPSASAVYPWDLVVVQKPETIEALSKATPWSAHVKQAAAVIVVVGHEEDSREWVEDCSVVAEHLWLEAAEQGLAGCWTQIRGNENAEKEVKKLLNIPEAYRVLCLMPLGAPAQEIVEHGDDDFDSSKIKYEKYK